MTHGTDVDNSHDGWLFGCEILTLPHFWDDRGWLSVLTPEGIGDAPYVYYSVTWVGKSRDVDRWHKHKNHTDRFVVVRGEVVFCVSDGVEMNRIHLGGTPCRMLVVPPGVLHCLKPRISAYEDQYAAVVNLPDMVYDPADELRVPFDAVDVERPW